MTKFSPAQLAAQKKFAARARAGTLKKGKRKTAKKKNPVKRGAKRAPPKRNPAKRNPAKYIIRAQIDRRGGYEYMYFNGTSFVDRRENARRYERAFTAETVMRSIFSRLPSSISNITTEKF